VVAATDISPARVDQVVQGHGTPVTHPCLELIAQAIGYDLTAYAVPPPTGRRLHRTVPGTRSSWCRRTCTA
jgi:hypothetical protein